LMTILAMNKVFLFLIMSFFMLSMPLLLYHGNHPYFCIVNVYIGISYIGSQYGKEIGWYVYISMTMLLLCSDHLILYSVVTIPCIYNLWIQTK